MSQDAVKEASVGPHAVKWSLIALAVIAAGVGGAFYFTRDTHSGPPQKLNQSMPAFRASGSRLLPKATSTDISAQASITFLHNNGACGDKLLPEPMGGGGAFFDYDNYGLADLLFVNSTWWPDKIPPFNEPATS